ncbi:MAG: hypothetical protein ACN6O1_07995 [Comamonas sp.]|uniref:hypothetical protein n=1 Tax=Comamonas sp. TaxID=34028 RepID=UPI003D10244C
MNDWEKRTSVLVTNARSALERGQFHAPPETPGLEDLLGAPLTLLGLVDISKLSQAGISFGRATGLAVEAMGHFSQKQEEEATATMAPEDAQCELFQHFERLFAALTGVAVEYIVKFEEVQSRLISRFQNEHKALAQSLKSVQSELVAFYNAHGAEMFSYAQGLGGMKAVAGGQRQFTKSGLEAARISGLYIDTQLIPDPVYPFFAMDLPLNAKLLQLAHVLYYLLQLKPLVDARLPVPVVVVFPSFEEPLEENDAFTKAGIEALLLQVVAPVCDGSITAVSELLEYAAKYPDKYLPAVMEKQLFVPAGHEAGDFNNAADALRAHIAGIEGRQSQKAVENFKKFPAGIAVTSVILDRLGPQYHLLENASQLGAQPLMALPVHWHYFGLCAKASAQEMVNMKVLSEENFLTLQALQDDSVSWLANIPIEGLVEIRRNLEVETFRQELKKYTCQLSAAGPLEINDVVREVNHGLASLVQRHAKAMDEVKANYWPKIVGAGAGAAVGALGIGSLAFLPTLAGLAGVAVSAGAVVGALGGGALSGVKEIASSKAEQRHLSRHSLIGMLATARRSK